jgi:glutathione S-transferase
VLARHDTLSTLLPLTFPRSNQLSPNARPDRDTLRPLTLWGFEGSPFVRPVREALSSLGLRYTLVSCARGSANRDRMFRKTGCFQAPYLEDPNTGVCMYESGEIVKYLMAAYTVPAAEQRQQQAQAQA